MRSVRRDHKVSMIEMTRGFIKKKIAGDDG